VLVWSRTGRATIWAFAAVLIGVVYGAPIVLIALVSVAGHWNGVLPSDFTLKHYAQAFSGDSAAELRASLMTGVLASGVALFLGTWAALAVRALSPATRRVLNVVFFIPSAVPSVSVGLGLLVAFSHPPLLLNGTTAIVIIAHFVLISAFTYGNISAGLSRLPSEFEQVAESLGARPSYRLRHVTLPLIAPHLLTAFSLSFALSMGELGATVMVYPPGWVTLPVGIFALTDRGAIFDGAALTVILVASTLAVLLVTSRRSRAVH
jgi:2-aminoethylphosphonate transport system permease protein